MTTNPTTPNPKQNNTFVVSLFSIIFLIAFCIGLENIELFNLTIPQRKAFIYTGVTVSFALGLIIQYKENNHVK